MPIPRGIRQPCFDQHLSYKPDLFRLQWLNASISTLRPDWIVIVYSGQIFSNQTFDVMPLTREHVSLQCSAHEYQALMHQGRVRSQDLVNHFLDQIERHNKLGLKLNAVLSVCPRDVAISQAKALDEERVQGKLRGELHGIPVIVKDCIVTERSLGMVSSAGSSAIASLRATRNASLVDRLLEAGMIVLGKGNLTEFCGLKSDNTPLGWSAYGGQTLSAYRRADLLEQEQPICGGLPPGPQSPSQQALLPWASAPRQEAPTSFLPASVVSTA